MAQQLKNPTNGAFFQWAARDLDLAAWFEQVEGFRFKPEKGKGEWLTFISPNDLNEVIVKRNLIEGGDPQQPTYVYGYFSRLKGRERPDGALGAGTLVDYLRQAHRLANHQIRDLLLPYYHGEKKPPSATVDYVDSRAQQHDFGPTFNHLRAKNHVRQPAFISQRGIPERVYNSPLFAQSWAVDRHGKVVFPHYGAFGGDRYPTHGVIGYETRDHGYKRHRGRRALWYSGQPQNGVARIIIAESPLDAMSYAALFDRGDALYLATGGGPAERMWDDLKQLVTEAHPKAAIFLIADGDHGGKTFFDSFQTRLESWGQAARIYNRQAPQGMDWNQVVQMPRQRFADGVRSVRTELQGFTRQSFHGAPLYAANYPNPPALIFDFARLLVYGRPGSYQVDDQVHDALTTLHKAKGARPVAVAPGWRTLAQKQADDQNGRIKAVQETPQPSRFERINQLLAETRVARARWLARFLQQERALQFELNGGYPYLLVHPVGRPDQFQLAAFRQGDQWRLLDQKWTTVDAFVRFAGSQGAKNIGFYQASTNLQQRLWLVTQLRGGPHFHYRPSSGDQAFLAEVRKALHVNLALLMGVNQPGLSTELKPAPAIQTETPFRDPFDLKTLRDKLATLRQLTLVKDKEMEPDGGRLITPGASPSQVVAKQLEALPNATAPAKIAAPAP